MSSTAKKTLQELIDMYEKMADRQLEYANHRTEEIHELEKQRDEYMEEYHANKQKANDLHEALMKLTGDII